MSDQRTSSGGSATAPTSTMWKSSFPKGQDPRDSHDSRGDSPGGKR